MTLVNHLYSCHSRDHLVKFYILLALGKSNFPSKIDEPHILGVALDKIINKIIGASFKGI